jgi:hypothetical protein
VAVNDPLERAEIVVRTGPGTKLAGPTGGPTVLEVDNLDPDVCLAWSVIVHGGAHRARVGARPARWWVSGAWTEAVRISPDEITGRRIVSQRPS